ncbi:hypothetical protein CCB80_14525 [Armatimonadetes bacterium Uphvl-Ar1]|nr:hypothetical protein CCB80_14525 [Armatimonadetes bacterium Uphvl-Ar1]
MSSQLLERGKSLFKSNQFSEAATAFQQVVEIDPSNTEAIIGLAFALHATSQSAEALQVFEKGIKLSFNQPELHFGHGLALMETGDPYRAINEFKRTLELNPNHPLATKMLQKALQIHTRELMAAGNFNWAEQAIQNQLELDPHCSDALAQLTEFKHKMAEYEEAKRHFRILTESKPDHPAIPDLAKLLGLIKHRERGWLY